MKMSPKVTKSHTFSLVLLEKVGSYQIRSYQTYNRKIHKACDVIIIVV